MSVLIATPAYGGQITVPYFHALERIRAALIGHNVEHDVLITSGDSHVTRARNSCVATFLNDTDYETLLFIDADVEIDSRDVITLLDHRPTMENGRGVRGAAVACKTPDFSEYLSLWVDGSRPTRKQMPSEPFCVDFLGTAVLAIDRKVFERLKGSDLVMPYECPIAGSAWDFFRDYVSDGVFLSEDYGFCELVRAHDIPVTCYPDIVVNHYGVAPWRF